MEEGKNTTRSEPSVKSITQESISLVLNVDYTTLDGTHGFLIAPGTDDYAHSTAVDLGGVVTKCVRITAIGKESNAAPGLDAT